MKFIDMTTGLVKISQEHSLDMIDLLILHHVYLHNESEKSIYIMDIPKLFNWVSLDTIRRRLKSLIAYDYLVAGGSEDARCKELRIGSQAWNVIRLIERAEVC